MPQCCVRSQIVADRHDYNPEFAKYFGGRPLASASGEDQVRGNFAFLNTFFFQRCVCFLSDVQQSVVYFLNSQSILRFSLNGFNQTEPSLMFWGKLVLQFSSLCKCMYLL